MNRFGAIAVSVAACLATIGSARALAATPTCETVDSVAAEAKAIGVSVITANPGSSSWTTAFTAGQRAFVTLKNGAPPHVTGVSVRFFNKTPEGEKDVCISQALVIPGTPWIVSHSVFGSAITYNLEVSLAQDVDVALVNIEVKALPKQQNQPKTKP